MHYDYSSDECILGSIYEIENILSDVKSVQDKLDFYKKLKKFRMESIDKEIQNMENKESKLRNIILENMKRLDPKKKTIDFPSIGKITRTSGKKTWVIDDEEELTVYLKNNKLDGAVIEKKESLSKKKLDALLKDSGPLPGVSQKEGNESISITFSSDDSVEIIEEVSQEKPKTRTAPAAVLVPEITESDL